MAEKQNDRATAAYDEFISGLAKQMGVSPEELSSQLGGTKFNPFQLDVSEATLYTGRDRVGEKLATTTSSVVGKTATIKHPKGTFARIGQDSKGRMYVEIAKDRTFKQVIEKEYIDDQPHEDRTAGLAFDTGSGQSARSPKQGSGTFAYTYRGDGTGGDPKFTDKTNSVEKELERLFRLPEERIGELKTQLWLAGYFGEADLEDINLQDLDNDTVSAFADVMLQASRYFKAGKKVTWQQLLEQKATGSTRLDELDDKPPVHVSLTDPAQLRTMARSAAISILGRNPSPDDIKMYVEGVHSKETAYDQAIQSEGDTVTAQVSPEAQAIEFFEQKYPNEAKAVLFADRASEWERLLSTSAQKPPTVQI